MAKVNSVLDGKSSEHSIINVDDLGLLEDLWCRQHNLVIHINRIALDWYIPVLQRLCLHKRGNAALHLGHFLVWRYPAKRQTVTHARTSANLLGNAIDTAELWRQVYLAVTMLYYEERLVDVCNRLFIDFLHVLSYWNLSTVVLKLFADWVDFEVNTIDDVGALVAPVCDNWGAFDVWLNSSQELSLRGCLAFDLVDLLEACDGWHEPE